MPLEILRGKQESDDYPYGRLRCHITFDLEFKDKKGYRFVTQTTNPKTGRVNKPKKSTYSDFMCLYRGDEGHVNHYGLSFHGYDDIQKMIDFLSDHEIEFTPEQSAFLWVCAIACIRNNARWTPIKEGAVSDFLEALGTQEMINKYGEKADFNEIKNVGFDLEKAVTFRKDA